MALKRKPAVLDAILAFWMSLAALLSPQGRCMQEPLFLALFVTMAKLVTGTNFDLEHVTSRVQRRWETLLDRPIVLFGNQVRPKPPLGAPSSLTPPNPLSPREPP